MLGLFQQRKREIEREGERERERDCNAYLFDKVRTAQIAASTHMLATYESVCASVSLFTSFLFYIYFYLKSEWVGKCESRALNSM
jgi:hypothetical protein